MKPSRNDLVQKEMWGGGGGTKELPGGGHIDHKWSMARKSQCYLCPQSEQTSAAVFQ